MGKQWVGIPFSNKKFRKYSVNMKNIKGRNGGTIKQSEPGDTGLPGAGRPKGSVNLSTKYKQFLEREEEFEVEGQTVKMSREEFLMFRLFSIATTTDASKYGVALAAIKELSDRAHGKAIQTNEIIEKDGQANERSIITVRLPTYVLPDGTPITFD
jgi:hypothetical protein